MERKTKMVVNGGPQHDGLATPEVPSGRSHPAIGELLGNMRVGMARRINLARRRVLPDKALSGIGCVR